MLTAGQHDIQCLQVCGPILPAQASSASEIPNLSRRKAVNAETGSDKCVPKRAMPPPHSQIKSPAAAASCNTRRVEDEITDSMRHVVLGHRCSSPSICIHSCHVDVDVDHIGMKRAATNSANATEAISLDENT